MVDLQTPNAPSDPAASSGEALSHLYKMSTTSAGGGDYIAINGTSIFALLLGVASVLAMAADVFLLVPLAGVFLAIIALIQIRNSSGTQSGRAFAFGGLFLAMLIGGAKIALAAKDWAQTRADTQVVAPMVDQLSKDIRAARYDEAYEDLFTSTFRARVSLKQFTDAFERVSASRDVGPITSIRWNHQRIEFFDIGTSGVRTGYVMCLIEFTRMSGASREVITFSTRDGTWKIDNIEWLFPEHKAKQALPQ
jgi:hypothetical protein